MRARLNPLLRTTRVLIDRRQALDNIKLAGRQTWAVGKRRVTVLSWDLSRGRDAFFGLKYWSEWQDLNLRPPRPERGALPDCATLRHRCSREAALISGGACRAASLET